MCSPLNPGDKTGDFRRPQLSGRKLNQENSGRWSPPNAFSCCELFYEEFPNSIKTRGELASACQFGDLQS